MQFGLRRCSRLLSAPSRPNFTHTSSASQPRSYANHLHTAHYTLPRPYPYRPKYKPSLDHHLVTPGKYYSTVTSTLQESYNANMDQAPDPRSKRKSETGDSPVDRPLKQMRVANGNSTPNTDGYSVNGDVNGRDVDMEDDIDPLSRTATAADTAEWQATIESVVKNVVSIHFCQTCSFDTDPAISSEATGFVVDAEKGYILTNRHVVGPGPFWGYCIFDNHEECDVQPVYRDPVHDFGILKFDPRAIKYMDVKALDLRPDLAKIGAEIRVVGNDAGEKLSILSGVISRLDRNAPDYGEGYSDFNTNYIQAAAAASGGSSGSPVVNIDGKAVALQAGGRADGAATDYFLPLDRPLRALKYIQHGQDVPRGSIQTQWLLKAFDDCRRLGLRPETEAMVRKQFPQDNNMLVAEVVLPDGPAGGQLEEGDVLIKINDQLISRFIPLDDLLDSHVGKPVKLLVERGGVDVEIEVTVGDLHAITPDRFVTVSGGSFHDLSYQQARLYAISLKNKGTYVAEAAGAFKLSGSESGWLIKSVDNKETPNLDTFIEVMKGIPDRARVVVQYMHLRDLHTVNTLIIHVDRHWSSKMRMAVRNDKTGLWDFTNLADALPALPLEPREAQFIQIANTKFKTATEIIKSFVKVTASMPIKLDGFPRGLKTGFGLVVDAAQGLVIVARAIVPYDMCDISLTIADSIIVPGKVVFLHPLQNYAVIKYDPSLVKAPVQSARLSEKSIQQGDETVFFGFNQNYRPVVVRTTVTDITTVGIPPSAATPRYRATNVDAVTVDTNMATQCGNGVLMNEDGTVEALWLTYMGERSSHNNRDTEYHLGLMTPGILPVIKQIQAGTIPQLRILNCETHSVQMSQARIMGVGEDWIRRVENEDPERHQLFIVRKVDFGHLNGLQESDVILTLNGKLITRVADLDVQYNNDVLEAVIIRKRQQMTISVPTIPTCDLETTRAIIFCGAVLHRPHHAVRQQISSLHSEVYVSGRMRGSPAYMYGLAPTNFLTHINGKPTPNLDAFLAEAIKIPDNTYFRVKVMTFDNVPWVATMKKNEHYFPTMEFVKDDSEELGWRRAVHESDKGGATELGEEGVVDIDPGVMEAPEVPEGLAK